VRAFGAMAVAAVLAGAATPTLAQGRAQAGELARLRAEAQRVRIVRDDWGIAHVHGHTDADAVFGMTYAQAEDDFNRVETNYLNAMGRLAEAEGEDAVWRDLRMKLFVDPGALKADYARSPAWLKALMDAWADGLNYYLAVHPEVKPRVITHFEPWMALSFTEGSIGGDIERVSLDALKAFYDKPQQLGAAYAGSPYKFAEAAPKHYVEPQGSNGIAIAPANTVDGHALLLINPHTSFFFRSELHIGWMHTSSTVDAVDEFAETVEMHDGVLSYRYGGEWRPVRSSTIVVPYRTAAGTTGARRFTVYRTHHGPIVRAADGRWIAVALMNKPIAALSQSYLRTKARDYASFLKVALTYEANSSNNTVFADDKGEIAYLHPQFIPVRDDRFDYTLPVDGSDPATDWKGLTPLDKTPHLLNPPNGWIMNTNNWPYSAAGPYSPKQKDFPRYMDRVGETPRGLHALRILTGKKDFTLERLNTAAFDSYLPAFARLIPALVKAYDATPDGDPLKARLKGQVDALKAWDDRWGLDSTETSLAVFWGDALWAKSAAPAKAARVSVYDWMADHTTPAEKLAALAEASDRLVQDFGSWKTPWGQINRFQRVNDDIASHFSDADPSIPVPFTSSQWGSLAAFGAKRYPGTKKYYGNVGNSFVAVVEFGPRVRAVAVTAGGESGHPGDKHFDDEAERYVTGRLREVYFYPDQLAGHTERAYRPGE
jgi:acyl-homoserine-lactone acylase